jgi:outer membrane immunogenic protein
MKRLLWGLFLAAQLTAPAAAADMALKAAPVKALPPVALYDWTGFYVGLQGGGDWFSKDWFTPTTPLNLTTGCNCGRPDGGHTANSWLFGGQAGFNYQVSKWVFGVEAEASWTDLRGSNTNPDFIMLIQRSRTDGLGTLTGRIGYAVDRVLIYGKGGGAWAHDRFATATGGRDIQALTDNRFGWTVGLGVEWAFANNWSVKVEYDHLDFGWGRETLQPLLAGGSAFEYDIRQRVDMVKAGVNYKFGGPVVARY